MSWVGGGGGGAFDYTTAPKVCTNGTSAFSMGTELCELDALKSPMCILLHDSANGELFQKSYTYAVIATPCYCAAVGTEGKAFIFLI